jgi:hypothetical protein
MIFLIVVTADRRDNCAGLCRQQPHAGLEPVVHKAAFLIQQTADETTAVQLACHCVCLFLLLCAEIVPLLRTVLQKEKKKQLKCGEMETNFSQQTNRALISVFHRIKYKVTGILNCHLWSLPKDK